MASDNNPNPADPSSSSSSPSSKNPSPSARKRKKWVKWAAIGGGVVVVGGGLLVLLAPTLLSTGMGKSIVLGQVNARLNGKVEIDSWSLGWWSPISVEGIKVYDDQNRLAMTVGKVTTGVTILKAARGDFNVGDVVVDSPNLVLVEVNADGTSNLTRLVKQSADAAKPAVKATTGSVPPPSNVVAAKTEKGEPVPAEKTKLPEVTGTVTIKNLQGAISGTAVGPNPVRIESSDIALKIPSLQNQPITDDIKLTVKRDGGQSGTFTIAGDVQAITQGVVDIDHLKASQKIGLAGVDLSAANAFLAPSGVKLTVGGIADGNIDVKAQGLDAASVAGEIKIAKLSAGGEMLKGDTFATDLMTIPLAITTSKDADGSPHVKVESLGAKSAELSADVKAEVSQKTLMNLAAQKAPGGTGNVDVVVSVPDASKLTGQFPHMLALGKGVSIKSGAANVNAHVGIEPAAANVVASVKVENVAGTNDGKPVSLQPINLDLDANAAFGGAATPALTVKKAGLTSGFATANLSGTQTDLAFVADVSLDQAKAQLGQFVDLQGKDFGGTLKANGTVKGDLLAHAPTAVAAHVEQANLRASGIGTLGTINVDKLVADVNTSVTLGADSAVTAGDTKATLLVGGGASPLIKADVSAAAIDPAAKSVQKFNVAADVTDLKEVQRQFGGLVAAIRQNNLSFQGGSVHVTAAGDVKDAKPALSSPAVIELRSATLYRGQTALLNNENLSVRADATSPDDFKTIKANVDVTGALVSATVQNATLNTANTADIWNLATADRIVVHASDLGRLQALADAFATAPATTGAPAAAATAPRYNGGRVAPVSPAVVPNTTAAAAAPAAAWKVTKGSLDVDLSVKRDGTKTQLAVSKLTVHGLSAQNGAATVNLANDVDLKVNASVDAALANGADVMHQIKSVSVEALSGSLGVATISTDEPIVLTDLAAAVPSARGAITVQGDVGQVTQLLEAVQNSPGAFKGYSGSFVVKQKLSSTPGAAVAAGTVQANVVIKDAAGATVFSDPKIEVANDLSVDPSKMDATIRKLTVATSSGAANVNVTGAVRDLTKTRTISEPLKVDVKYDLAKAMPLAQPFLSQGARDMLAGSTIAGQKSESYVVTGSYPAGVPSNEAIKNVTVTGGVGVDVANIPTQGVQLQNLDLAFKLEKGIATVSMPKPAALNAGTLNLNGAAVNLTTDVPRLNMPDNTVLVDGIALNKVLSDKLGTFLGPIFVNTDKASGLVKVTMVKVTDMPLGALAMENAPANDGSAQVKLGITNLELVGGFAGDFLRQIPAIGNYFVGNVKDGTFTIAHGIVDHDLAISVGTGVTGDMRFSGKIELFGEQRLNPMQVRVGSNLLKDKIPFVKNVVQLADPVFVIKGTLRKPQLDFAAGIGQWVKDQGKGLLPGLLGGGVPGSQASTQPADKKSNPIEDLGKLLGGGDKKKKKK